MPTYEYACPQCGHQFEAFQSMKDEPLKICPGCKQPTLKRLLGTGAGLIFKGSGFYITDYKNKGGTGGSGDKAGAKESGGGSSTPSKPAETKPASSGASASK